MIQDIGKKEEKYFTYKLYNTLENKKRRKCYENDPYKIELWNINNLNNNNVIDNSQLGVDDIDIWKYRYYEHHFKLYGDQKLYINKLLYNYLSGIKWISEYYFNECCDWRWCYNFYYAPFISDLGEYLKIQDVSRYENIILRLNLRK